MCVCGCTCMLVCCIYTCEYIFVKVRGSTSDVSPQALTTFLPPSLSPYPSLFLSFFLSFWSFSMAWNLPRKTKQLRIKPSVPVSTFQHWVSKPMPPHCLSYTASGDWTQVPLLAKQTLQQPSYAPCRRFYLLRHIWYRNPPKQCENKSIMDILLFSLSVPTLLGTKLIPYLYSFAYYCDKHRCRVLL